MSVRNPGQAKASLADGAVAISATFTAEPITDVLQRWLDRLGLPLKVQHAAYNQVFQALLDPASRLAKNDDGFNVILFRWQDLGQLHHIASNATSLIETVTRFGT